MQFRIPPFIEATEFPAEDADRIRVINFNLMSLDTYCNDLQNAVELYNFVKQKHAAEGQRLKALDAKNASSDASALLMYGSWLSIAARDAATTIYKFEELLSGTSTTINECDAVQSKLNPRVKKRATGLFSREFPHHKGLRHASAHGNLYAKVQSRAENALPSGSIISGVMLKGDYLTATFAGKIIAFQVTQSTVDSLYRVRDLYWEYVSPVDTRRVRPTARPKTSFFSRLRSAISAMAAGKRM